MQRRSRKRKPSLTRAEWTLIGAILLWYAVTLFWYRGGLDWTGHRISTGLGVVALGVLVAGGRRPFDRLRAGTEGGAGGALRGSKAAVAERQSRCCGHPEDALEESNQDPHTLSPTAAEPPSNNASGTPQQSQRDSATSPKVTRNGGPAAPQRRFATLLRFPAFWLGVVVLGYMGIQLWNQAWEYFPLGDGIAYLIPVDHVTWLPSGVSIHVTADNNPLNGFLQVALPWLLFCVVAIGLRRRGVSEAGGRGTEDGGRGTEDGGRRTEDGGRRTEAGGRGTEAGGRRTGDGGALRSSEAAVAGSAEQHVAERQSRCCGHPEDALEESNQDPYTLSPTAASPPSNGGFAAPQRAHRAPATVATRLSNVTGGDPQRRPCRPQRSARQRRRRRSPGLRSSPTDARWVLAIGFLIITGLWSLMALWHYYAGMTHLYGFIDIGRNNTPPYWGSLRNPRHGGFLQMLGTVLALALAFRELRKGEVAMRSGLPWFYFGVAAFFTYATVQTLSRGSTALTVLLWCFAAVVGLLWGWRSRIKGVIPAVCTFFVLFLIGAGSFLYLNLQNPDNRDFQNVFRKAVTQWEGEGDVGRNILYRVGWRMHQANAPMGTGIGSFGLLYRGYVELGEERITQTELWWQRDPVTGDYVRDPETGVHIPVMIPIQFWHAHNDALQFLIELGWIGFTPLVLLFFYPFFAHVLHAVRAGLPSAALRGSEAAVAGSAEQNVAERRSRCCGHPEDALEESNQDPHTLSPTAAEPPRNIPEGDPQRSAAARNVTGGDPQRARRAPPPTSASPTRNSASGTPQQSQRDSATSPKVTRNGGSAAPRAVPETLILLFGIVLVAMASVFDFPMRTPAFGLFFGLIAALAMPEARRPEA